MNSQGQRFLQRLVIRYCDWGGSSRGMRLGCSPLRELFVAPS